jgi:dienelactone hydrolase
MGGGAARDRGRGRFAPLDPPVGDRHCCDARAASRAWRQALRRFVLLCLALAALIAPGWAPLAAAEELVRFKSAAPRGHTDVSGGADVQGYLAKPKGAGPFPAVVLLHSCLGLPSNRRGIESALAASGYVALFVDDFATRRLKETCAVDFPVGVADAYGALAFLSTLPYVDRARIAVVGFSQGADTALSIAAERAAPAYALPEGLRFRAAAAFYPPCANQENAPLSIPTLILVGGSDDVTPAADCERLMKTQSGGVRLVVYPGAGHCFDDPEFAGGKRLMGMTLKYDPGAAERATAALGAFLAERLAR